MKHLCLIILAFSIFYLSCDRAYWFRMQYPSLNAIEASRHAYEISINGILIRLQAFSITKKDVHINALLRNESCDSLTYSPATFQVHAGNRQCQNYNIFVDGNRKNAASIICIYSGAKINIEYNCRCDEQTDLTFNLGDFNCFPDAKKVSINDIRLILDSHP